MPNQVDTFASVDGSNARLERNEALKQGPMFSILSCVGLFALEAIYIVAFYDPAETKIPAGLILIFWLEASFLLKFVQCDLEEGKRLGKVSGTTRFYAAIAILPLFGVTAIALAPTFLNHLKQDSWLWIALFLISGVGKIIWRYRMVWTS